MTYPPPEHIWTRIPLKHVRSRTPLPLKHVRNGNPSPVTLTLSRHDVIWQKLTIYSDDSCRCAWRLCTVTNNSDDILTRVCLGKYLPPSNMFGHVPPVNKPCQDMTSFGNTFYRTQRWVTIAKAVWRHLVTLLRRRDSSFISMTYFKACSNRIPPKINVKAVTLNTVKYFLHYFWFVFSFKFFFLIYKSIKNCQI